MLTNITEDFLFALAHCPFLTHKEKWYLASMNSPYYEDYTFISYRTFSVDHSKQTKFYEYLKTFDFVKERKAYQAAGVELISLESTRYPVALRNSYEPPFVLFCQGDLSLLNAELIGIVGARECTAYGQKVLDRLIPPIVEAGLVTVSGLARGIDTHVHKKTIDKGGKTIAVIGSGIGYTYPYENEELQEDIARHHLLISEYPLNLPPKRHHFPLRNRIIAGLSRGVTVVEAKERSGSLITARIALDEGRDVFAVPGSIFSAQSRGCLDLIRSGAVPCLCAEDIFTEWNMEIVK